MGTARISGGIVGGVAASLHGRPRMTRDVDVLVLVPEAEWSDFLAAGRKHGFQPRRADVIPFAEKSHVLLVRHEPSGIDVDIVLGALPFEQQVVDRMRRVRLGSISVPLATPEDLIIMKAVAGRPRDQVDIESLLDAHPRLDLKRVRRWVREFSVAMAMPEIYDRLNEHLVKRSRKVSRRKKPVKGR